LHPLVEPIHSAVDDSHDERWASPSYIVVLI
jgi:hypothetical protein